MFALYVYSVVVRVDHDPRGNHPPFNGNGALFDATVLKGEVTASWHDPTSGNYKMIPGSPFANKGTHEFNPPGINKGGANDWVLVLESNKSGN